MLIFFLEGHTKWLSEVLQSKSFYDSVFVLWKGYFLPITFIRLWNFDALEMLWGYFSIELSMTWLICSSLEIIFILPNNWVFLLNYKKELLFSLSYT